MSVLFSLSDHYGAFGERQCWSLRVQDDDHRKQVRPNHSFNTDTNGATYCLFHIAQEIIWQAAVAIREYKNTFVMLINCYSSFIDFIAPLQWGPVAFGGRKQKQLQQQRRVRWCTSTCLTGGPSSSTIRITVNSVDFLHILGHLLS